MRKDSLIEQYCHEYLKAQYVKEQHMIKQSIDILNSVLLNKYKKLYPYHFISYCRLKHFIRCLSKLKLLPTEDEYIKLHKDNDFFDIELIFFISEDIQINFQYPINITKVNAYIKDKNIRKAKLEISVLKQIIRKVCFDEFDSDMEGKRNGLDYLEKIKSQNPIMLLNRGDIFDTYLINGNHRVIQAIRDNKKNMDVYMIPESLIKCCGMTEDYEKLYSIMRNIPSNIYGGKYISDM